MGETRLFAASAAALIVACIAGWAVSETQVRADMRLGDLALEPGLIHGATRA